MLIFKNQIITVPSKKKTCFLAPFMGKTLKDKILLTFSQEIIDTNGGFEETVVQRIRRGVNNTAILVADVILASASTKNRVNRFNGP